MAESLKKSGKAAAAKKAAPKVETEEVVVEATPIVEPVKKKAMVPKRVDPNQIVTVRNGFQGQLVYKSRKTGERFVWDAFGDEQDMEIGEVKSARNSDKKYFEANWFMFDEDWIPKYLGVEKMYKNAIPIDKFDDLFEKSPEEIKSIISKLSEGQKRSVAYRAKELITEGGIDSNRVISTLEEALGFDLIER